MYLAGSELKARAKAQLGHSLFGKVWLYAVITVAVQAAVSNVISLVFKNVSFGGLLNSLITGPLSVSVAYMFLNQCRDGVGGSFVDQVALDEGGAVEFHGQLGGDAVATFGNVV